MPDTLHRTVLPKADWNGRAADLRSRLMTWDWHWRLPGGKTELQLDFSKVSFMEPWALAMFAAYGLGLRQRGIPVNTAIDTTNPSNLYFADMGLMELLDTGGSSAATRTWSASHQNTGLHLVRDYRELKAFLDSASRLTLSHCEEAADALRYVMSELARNVLQHSGSPVGGVAIAQHFPERGALQVAICDLGRGVFAALHDRYPEIRTSMEALRLAILPHVSGALPSSGYANASENAGLGLFFSREIAWRAGGSFWLVSHDALLGLRGDVAAIWERDPAEPDRVYRPIRPWPGTLVVMDFPVDGIPDFAAILRICSQLADDARRLSGPAGLDFLGPEAETEKAFVVAVEPFAEDNATANQIRDRELRPRIETGEPVVLDFAGVRSPTQSFVHALLSEILKIPGSLVRLSFVNCTPSAREILKAVAAYAASYRQIV